MKIKYALLFLLMCTFSFAQTVFYEGNDPISKEKPNKFKLLGFTHFELSTPLKFNPEREDEDADNENQSWFIPDGLNAKFGYGIHYEEAITLSVHSGIEWEITDKLVVAPVFGNINFSPFISDDAKIGLQFGYGKAFVLGRGHLQGMYKRFALSLEAGDGFGIFAEVVQYRMNYNGNDRITNLNLGVSYRLF
ncbi:MAG: hypothetical protein PSV16_12880 [Flavobacterium sp.]|nr:hypothetical protein [Flavobacterium sp.]